MLKYICLVWSKNKKTEQGILKGNWKYELKKLTEFENIKIYNNNNQELNGWVCQLIR